MVRPTHIPYSAPMDFWWRWLVAVAAGLVVFGLVLVVLPTFTLAGFSLLIYANTQHLGGFDPGAVAYIQLVHAVLGAVMVGWGTLLLLVLLSTFRQNPAIGCKTIAASALAWFVPDTAYSLVSGFWQNAAFNLVFAMLFAVPLLAIKRALDRP